jgi:hypothetical protein
LQKKKNTKQKKTLKRTPEPNQLLLKTLRTAASTKKHQNSETPEHSEPKQRSQQNTCMHTSNTRVATRTNSDTARSTAIERARERERESERQRRDSKSDGRKGKGKLQTAGCGLFVEHGDGIWPTGHDESSCHLW